MKRIACVLVAFMTVVSVSQAQLKFGIKAGANVNSLTSDVSAMLDQVKESSNYQFGVLFQAKALGFTVQPEVLYVVKSSMINNLTIEGIYSGDNVEYKTQNIEVPLNLQYGFGFIVGRAYLQAGPYVSFVASTLMDGEESFDQNLKNSMSTFDYGVGAGFGVELLGFQLSAKYDWGMGKLGDAHIPTGVGDAVTNNPFNNMQNKTLNVSLAYLF
jgi:hypothetical protein